MNKQRKERFQDVITCLEEAKDELYDIQGEEQDAYDSLSEGLQCSDRGDVMLEWVDFMEEVVMSIDDVIEAINKKTK